MKRTVVIVALVVAVTAAAVAALPWLLTPPLFGLQIAAAVERATGRTLTFAGRPQLTLWPEVTLGLEQVELSNPPGMFEGRSLAVDTLRFKVSLASLLTRKPEVEEIVAVRPRINLVVDSNGRSNFAPNAKPEADDNGGREAGDTHEPASLPPIAIVDGEIKYLNERSGKVLTLSNVELSVSQGQEEAVHIRGGFHWARQPVAAAVYIKSPARLAADGSPGDVTLTSPLFNAAFNGRAALANGLELAGTLDFSSDSLSQLATAAGLAESVAPHLASFSVAGAVDVSRRSLRFKDAELGFGSTRAKGDVAVSFKGARPRITGKLGLDRVDLTTVPAQDNDEPGEAIADWSALPLRLSPLSVLDARLSLAASEIAYGSLATGPARVDVRLEGARLDVTVGEMALYGGTAAGRLTVDGSGPVPRLSGTLEGRGIDGRRAADLTGRALVDGTAELDLDLSAIGLSPRELVGRLEGSGRLSLTNGAIGIDVADLLAGLEAGIVKDWAATAEGRTWFSALEASFTVADGIAETDDLALDGPAARVSGAGNIDVLRQRLDFRLTPQVLVETAAGDGAFRSFPVPVVIDGFWSAPRIYPGIDGILEDPGSAMKALQRKMQQQASDLDLKTDKTEKALKKASRLPVKAPTNTAEQAPVPADSSEARQ